MPPRPASGPTATTSGAERTRRSLLAWFAASGRDLPWRRTRDPWAVLVAELMLQQTQVARVVPAHGAFLAQFPTVAACAGAPVGEVVRAWAGLGYNRRAVQLHAAATAIVDRHGGVVPRSLPTLLALPGVGPYTARAVLVFANEQPAAVVDTNVARVLARWAGRPLSRSEVQAVADAWVPVAQPWAWNQAIVDLGATVCTARAPRCAGCPVRRACVWRGGTGGGADPAARPARQAPFAGSDREGRGRLVAAVRRAPVRAHRLAGVMGWADDPARAERVAAALVRDGVVARRGDTYRLP